MTFVKPEHRPRLITALGLTLTTLASGIAQAADSDLQKQIDSLDQQLRVLQRKLELSDENAAKAKTETAVLVAGDKGFGIKSSDGKFELKLRGLLQADARVFQEGIKNTPSAAPDFRYTDATDDYLLRRVRPSFEGKFYDIYGFRITSDYGNGATTLVDAYIDANFDPAAKVRVGKFTPPVGFERLQSSADTKFNELSLVSNFLPSRDVGGQVSGDLFEGVLNYAVGLFDGANDGASGDNDINTDKEIAARIAVQPLVNYPGLLQGLTLAVGHTFTDAEGALTPGALPQGVSATGLAGYRTSGQQTFFNYLANGTPTTANTVYANGDRERLVPQFSYYYGPVGVTGEYLEQSQELTIGLRSEEVNHRAWNVTASWVLTGEEASSKSVKPNNVFNPSAGGWGAWEVKARVGELTLDGDVFRDSSGAFNTGNRFADANRSAQNADNVGFGVNWYLNNFARVSLDYEKTKFNWGGGGTVVDPLDRPDEEIFIGRIQVSY